MLTVVMPSIGSLSASLLTFSSTDYLNSMSCLVTFLPVILLAVVVMTMTMVETTPT